MFGYVKPDKSELLIREFTYYRSIYCGICKSLSRRYGQIPRLAVTYDMTFFALLLFAFSEEAPDIEADNCILHPVRKRAIHNEDPVLDLTADATVILMAGKFRDDIADGSRLKGHTGNMLLKCADRKAAQRLPDFHHRADELLGAIARAEKTDKPYAELSDAERLEPARLFGEILTDLMREGLKLLDLEAPYDDALIRVADYLGRWVYLIDAIDDLPEDSNNKEWNPFKGLPDPKRYAEAALKACEAELDRTCSLLPYRRDAAIVGNIIGRGLPRVRERIFAGEKPEKI